ncbi:hypothetical protein LEP1GSC166_0169 [Leptospira kirschneri]|nr:hypothetical protein LEP1GSC166_0169 [Leptospira kirschneri]
MLELMDLGNIKNSDFKIKKKNIRILVKIKTLKSLKEY